MKTHGEETTKTSSRTPRKPRIALPLFVISLWLVFGTASFASESGEKKRILVLYSFRFGIAANELVDVNAVVGESLQATLEKNLGGRVALHSERMDVSELSENRYFETLRDVYRI